MNRDVHGSLLLMNLSPLLPPHCLSSHLSFPPDLFSLFPEKESYDIGLPFLSSSP